MHRLLQHIVACAKTRPLWNRRPRRGFPALFRTCSLIRVVQRPFEGSVPFELANIALNDYMPLFRPVAPNREVACRCRSPRESKNLASSRHSLNSPTTRVPVRGGEGHQTGRYHWIKLHPETLLRMQSAFDVPFPNADCELLHIYPPEMDRVPPSPQKTEADR